MWQPIFIASPPRSGTSMISGLLEEHGVWTGRHEISYDKIKDTNPKGVFENLDLKELTKKQMKQAGINQMPFPPIFNGDKLKFDKKLREKVYRIVGDQQYWLFKEPRLVKVNEIWQKSFPEAIWILPDRKDEDILKSMKKHPHISKQTHLNFQQWINEAKMKQKDIAKSSYHIFVDPDDFIHLRHSKIQLMFDYIGIEYNKGIAEQWIEGELWHGKKHP